ncbi:MAG: GC-type dockerin domain-anchored protein [Phycisphaerales bacterium]
MKHRVAALSAAGLVVSAGVAFASGPTLVDPAVRARSMLQAGVNGLIGSPDAGPDVIVGELMQSQSSSGSMALTLAPLGTVGAVNAYSVGTTSCNIGTASLLWQANNPNHPVIAQNMYRLKNGRLEMIGIGWLKHGFTALTYNACSNEGYTCNGLGGAVLGVGCSDPYSSSLNGSQGNLGPRYQVNASTGAFPFPYASHPNSTALSKRIQVAHADIEDSVQNPNTLYFAEGIYITPDDTAAGNNANNASYRRMTVNGTSRTFTLTDQTRRRDPAIHAWKQYGGPGGTVDNSVVLNPVDVQGDGRFWIGSKAWSAGNGLWNYEYVVYNLTSDRAAGAVAVPVPLFASATSIGFHDVNYHSGETWDGTDFTSSRTGPNVVWNSPQTHAQNALANAVRWGTMYNYRFQSNVGPKNNGSLTVGLFKPTTAGSPAAEFSAPAIVPCPCQPDMTGDCQLSVADFGSFQTRYVLGDLRCDFNADGQLTVADFGSFQNAYNAGCSQ